MPVALIFDREDGPSRSIDNKNVDSFAVDRVKGVMTFRRKDFAEAGLCKDAMTCAMCFDLAFDDSEHAIFRMVQQASLLK